MSGGRFEYLQMQLTDCLYGYDFCVDYGDKGRQQSKKARGRDPFHEREVSELVWDVLCLIHSLDWWESGDTGGKDYLDDLKKFKEKWMNRTGEDKKQAYINDLQEYYERLIKEFKGDNGE